MGYTKRQRATNSEYKAPMIVKNKEDQNELQTGNLITFVVL